MTIHPFLAGILITLGVELLLALVLFIGGAIRYYKKHYTKGNK